MRMQNRYKLRNIFYQLSTGMRRDWLGTLKSMQNNPESHLELLSVSAKDLGAAGGKKRPLSKTGNIIQDRNKETKIGEKIYLKH